MNSMDLVKGLNYLEDDLISDAAEEPEKGATQGGGAKAPKPKKPNGGGIKVKALVIGICAIVCAAALVIGILFATGVFGSKVAPVYQGMEISSASTAASASAASRKISGDYNGRNNDFDKNDPYGTGSSGLQSEVNNTLKVVATEDLYYADLNEDILITINFDNPSEYEIISFVINGTRYQTTMFVYGDYNKIIISVNVGSDPGIIDYAISEIKYIDGSKIKDVTIEGDTIVSCGVRDSTSMVTASVTDEETTLTSISFTANISDTYSLIEYSGGEIKAVLYDGESIVATQDLALGKNTITFTDLTPNTLYQYAVVAYFDDLSGTGAAVNYLYTMAVYTQAVVLFDNVDVGVDSVSFAYSWYSGYENTAISALTLTCGETVQNLDATDTAVSGLTSYTEYTLTAYYAGINGVAASISLTFTTDPYVAFNSVTANASTIVYGDTLTLIAYVTNTDGVTFTSVTINGVNYATTPYGNTLYIYVANDGTLDGGNLTLEITKLTGTLGGNTYTWDITENNTVSAFFYNDVTVNGFAVVRYENGEYSEVDYSFADETLYYMLTLTNNGGYSVTSVTINDTEYTDIVMSDDKQYAYIAFTPDASGYIDAELVSAKYTAGEEGSSNEKTVSYQTTYLALTSASTEVVEITTADDLLDMDDYKYYKLANNINLAGVDWSNNGNAFYGVLEGGGYTIENINVSGNYTNTDVCIGLFSEADGIINNLNIANMNFIINVSLASSQSCNVYVGTIAGSGNIVLNNCSINSVIISVYNHSGGDVFVGGVTGTGANQTVNSSTINVTISVDSITDTTSSENASGFAAKVSAGGIVGYNNGDDRRDITGGVVSVYDSSVTVSITANWQTEYWGSSYGNLLNVGGIAGCATLVLDNVTVNSTLNVTASAYMGASIYIGGLTGYNNIGSEVASSVNKVNLTSTITANITDTYQSDFMYPVSYINAFLCGEDCGVTDCTADVTINVTSNMQTYILLMLGTADNGCTLTYNVTSSNSSSMFDTKIYLCEDGGLYYGGNSAGGGIYSFVPDDGVLYKFVNRNEVYKNGESITFDYANYKEEE